MEKSEQLEIGSTHKGKRVEIFMEVDDHGAIRKESIPFVVGVLAPLAGDAEGRPAFKEREAREIDRENFDQVMAAIGPELHYSVDYELLPSGSETAVGASGDRTAWKLGVNLAFSSMDDFEPERVARQIPELESMLEERRELYSLLRRLNANGRLGEEIEAALEDPARREELLRQLQRPAET